MFEHHQEEMEKLMKENEDFLRIYGPDQGTLTIGRPGEFARPFLFT
jgi:hypothetical protein